MTAPLQDVGLGKALLDRITYAARNRAIGRRVLLCHAGNTAGARLERHDHEVWATLELPPATLATVMPEHADDFSTLG